MRKTRFYLKPTKERKTRLIIKDINNNKTNKKNDIIKFYHLKIFLTNKNKHFKNFILIILITGLYLYFKIIIHKNELQYS